MTESLILVAGHHMPCLKQRKRHNCNPCYFLVDVVACKIYGTQCFNEV